MASIFGHGLVGATLAASATPSKRRGLGLLCALCAAAPDLDVIGLYFGVPYGSPFGHRGFTHSILFAVLMGICLASRCAKEPGMKRRYFICIFLATLSHGVIDALTNGGRGIAFFFPFHNGRYFFPWRPIQVSPIGRNFFSRRGLQIIQSELLWLGVPCLLIGISKKTLFSLAKIRQSKNR